MHFFVSLLSPLLVLSIFFALHIDATTLDEGNSCIVHYLKNQKKLSAEFPSPIQPDLVKCKIVMALILKNFESALKTKLSDKSEEKINVMCIMEHFKNTSAMDYMLMREVIPMSRSLENSEITQKTRNATKVLRKILLSGAKKCASDQSYGGLFDDILGFQNLSLHVLQHNYCYTKYAIDNNLIEVKHFNMNPRRISTTDLDCEEMIDVNQVARERHLLERLNDRRYTKERVQCIMDKYRSEKAFDSNLALEVIDLIHISYEEKRANREKIASLFENFIKSIFVCSQLSREFNHDNVKIMQL